MCILGMLTHSLTKNNRKASLMKLRMVGGTPQSSCTSSPALSRSPTLPLSTGLRMPLISVTNAEDRKQLFSNIEKI